MALDRRPVAVLAALDVEAAALARGLTRSEALVPALRTWEGDLEGTPVVLVLTGIGKVAAAMAAQLVCQVHHPRYLLSIGLAGATDNGPRGRLIVASGAAQHDVDVRPLTRARGTIAGLNMTIFPADPELAGRLKRAAESVVAPPAIVQLGLVLTGDQIVASREVRERIRADFPQGACLEMETAAIAQVARANGVPWGGLRITSDSADESFDLDQVLAFGAGTAGDVFERIIRAVLKKL
jgi:adenosylhomocysteine nucleosidase